MKFIKLISLFLGISLFLFGVLKFVHPFKGWYSIQIANSGMGELSYTMGILGELSVGVSFVIILFVFRHRVSRKQFLLAIILTSVVVIIMMLTGIYVHLHPNVPADVLPLKIKPPLIPGFFLLGLVNIVLAARQYRSGNK